MQLPNYYKTSIVSPDDSQNDRIWINRSENRHALDYPLSIMWSGYSWWGPSRKHIEKKRQMTGLEVITGGDMVVHHKSRLTTILKPGAIFFHKHGNDEWYETGPSGFLHKRFICFAGRMLTPNIQGMSLWDEEFVQFDSPQKILGLVHLLKESNRIIGSEQPDMGKLLASVVFDILLELISCLSTKHYPPCIKDAIEFMDSHLDRMVSLAELSKAANLSVTHLLRQFQTFTQQTPARFFMKRKMLHAQQLLTNKNDSIKTIADELGYKDQFLFSTQFKRVFGYSPKHFRKTHFK